LLLPDPDCACRRKTVIIPEVNHDPTHLADLARRVASDVGVLVAMECFAFASNISIPKVAVVVLGAKSLEWVACRVERSDGDDDAVRAFARRVCGR
jgi:hypothetical protein